VLLSVFGRRVCVGWGLVGLVGEEWERSDGKWKGNVRGEEEEEGEQVGVGTGRLGVGGGEWQRMPSLLSRGPHLRYSAHIDQCLGRTSR
jgi:hypothetical protein